MIAIQDNDNIGKVCHLLKVSDLLSVANKPIQQLCEEDNDILVFPLSIDDSDDRIGDSHIVDIYTEDCNSVRIKSGNIMGFVGRKSQQLKIYSRFDSNNNDYFLHYMLQKVLSFNVFNMEFTSSEENVFDFLLYLFPTLLKHALRQGLYKEYRRKHYNDSEVRGTIDISRHIKENIPFRGTVAYNTREYSYDNSVTELIRHTIEFIRTFPIGNTILSSDRIVEEYIRDIFLYTPSYNRAERMRIINENLRPRCHPYYKEYTTLQKLCVQILRQEEIKYRTDDDRIYGILFDGAWLWEEYLNTLLCKKGFIHPENKLGTGAIYLFEHGGQRFPDFWKQDIVLDAKYKKLAINGTRLDIERDDVHQIMAYMYRLKASKGGIICPYKGEKNKIISQNMHKDSYLGSLSLYALAIPKNCSSYGDFTKLIVENERTLLEELS
ncbi:5-methylcytosine restriction system specificity protein McrC [Prevotellamassilia timonensis]|uniref:5-methylcytosine restriction system specificity protein McrC n=1 Tax=Prevotellamassilia timonensis TaxID=1852370 RepID=UPI004025F583